MESSNAATSSSPTPMRRRCWEGTPPRWRLALSHEHDAYYFEPHLDEAANAVALHSGGAREAWLVEVARVTARDPTAQHACRAVALSVPHATGGLSTTPSCWHETTCHPSRRLPLLINTGSVTLSALAPLTV